MENRISSFQFLIFSEEKGDGPGNPSSQKKSKTPLVLRRWLESSTGLSELEGVRLAVADRLENLTHEQPKM